MNHNQRLKICQQCVFKKEDIKRGLLCSLTGRQPNFIGNCPSYKENTLIIKGKDSFFDFGNKKSKIEKEPKQQAVRTFKTVKTTGSYTKSKSSGNGKIAWKLVVFLFILFKIGFKYYSHNRSKKLNKYQQVTEYTVDDFHTKESQKRKAKKRLKRLRPSAIKLMVPQNRLNDKRIYLENDTTFTIANKIKITLNKQYYISFKKNDELPLYATARKYTFTYNKVKKDKHKTMKAQWLDYRKQLYPNIIIKENHLDTKEKIPVEKVQFFFDGTYKTYGVAKLIEIGNTRYFFQFTYMNDTEKYGQLSRYLNYYVQIKQK